MAKSLHELRTSGFSRLREGRIHMRCPECGRKVSNTQRTEYDLPQAVLVENYCPDCAVGSKDPPITYFDANGVEVPDSHECEDCGCMVFHGERHDCDGVA